MGGNYSCPNSQNDALIIPWPASESAWKSCALGRMLNHFLTRDLDHESYTHEKGRGKNEQQITKWKEHLQPEKNTARMEHNKTESDLSDQEKNPLNYYALLGALLCHCLIAPALQAAGSKRGLSPRRRRPQAVILVAGDLNQDPILSRGGGSSDI